MNTDTHTQALRAAIDALEEIALAGMSGTGQETEEGMRDWHARQAWKLIGIAARALDPLRAALAAAEAQPVLPDFEHPTVQQVYEILCSDNSPPEGHHWEGFAARRIVAAIGAAAQPVAVPQGLPELRIESDDEETVQFFFAGQLVSTATYDEYGSEGLRGMKRLAQAMCAALAAAPAAPAQAAPLTEEQIKTAVYGAGLLFTKADLEVARAIERAHGIGGKA